MPLCYLQTSLPNEVCRQVGTTRWSRLGTHSMQMCRKAVWLGYSLVVNAWWAVGIWASDLAVNVRTPPSGVGHFSVRCGRPRSKATEMGPYLQETCEIGWVRQILSIDDFIKCTESYDCHFSNTDTESYWGWQTSLWVPQWINFRDISKGPMLLSETIPFWRNQGSGLADKAMT